jgi:hypothetical protein
MSTGRWLMILHQIPPKPAYFRAKVLKRLTQVGALQLKNSAYMLPDREDTLEDFEWICQEIVQEGGSAWLFRSEALAGMSSEEIEESFRRLHKAEYVELIESAQLLMSAARPSSEDDRTTYAKLSRRQQELRRIDFFEPPERGELDELMSRIDKQIRTAGTREASGININGSAFLNRIWVTRAGIKEDRIASAWLIKRFIDSQATFQFVDVRTYAHEAGKIRFDMVEGEFTHRGDSCTFEVLIADHDLAADAALVAIGQIIHDIDLKDDRFQRPETVGIARMIEGLCLQTRVDVQRLERGFGIFETLYESLTQRAPR